MEIQINGTVSVRQQWTEQMVSSNRDREARRGTYNTVSEAYPDGVRRSWLVGRRGSRLIVQGTTKCGAWRKEQDVDDFIHGTIRLGHQQGTYFKKIWRT